MRLSGVVPQVDVPNARLWSPDSPYLYDLDVWIVDAKSAASASDVTMVDHVRSYCGMRKISLGRDSQGTLRLMLNDEFIFQASSATWQGTWTLPHTAQQYVKGGEPAMLLQCLGTVSDACMTALSYKH